MLVLCDLDIRCVNEEMSLFLLSLLLILEVKESKLFSDLFFGLLLHIYREFVYFKYLLKYGCMFSNSLNN